MQNVYSQVKMFHFSAKLQDLQSGRVTPPVHIRLKPINACNHKCFYCCYRNPNLFLNQFFRENDMIPEIKMIEIVRDLAEGGVRAVTFTGGGEPLIYPSIIDSVTYLLEHGVKVAVLTNGSRLSGDRARCLAEGASWVRISIDAADREIFSRSRGADPADFDRIIENIEEFARIKHSGCELGINFIITELNVDRVYEFISLMKNKGADHVKVSECVVSTKGFENNSYHSKHFSRVKCEIERANKELSSDTFRVINKFHDFEDQYEKSYHSCPFISFINVVAADLNVYACQDKAYTQSGFLGSLKEQSLRELWDSEAYKLKIQSLNPSKVCDHHCVQHGKNLMLLDFMSTDARHLEFV